MTNASVRPALARIEKKLQEIDLVMNGLGVKTNNPETKNDETTSETVEKLDWKCKNVEIVEEAEEETKENSGESESE